MTQNRKAKSLSSNIQIILRKKNDVTYMIFFLVQHQKLIWIIRLQDESSEAQGCLVGLRLCQLND